MRSTKQLSITLPTEMAEMIRGKVASGEYASESEVIRDGLRALLARDRALDHWLREEVAPAYDAMKAGTTKPLTVAAVKANLLAEHQKKQRDKVTKKPR
ncbi:MAG TPA: type II toxin-antitoxin system ParD family antitoxin [Dongiaceae bacterium]